MRSSAPPNASRDVSGAELLELALLAGAFLLLAALGTWAGRFVGVPAGWRLAAGACVAIPIVGGLRLARYRQAPTWRWFGALLALWGLVAVANVTADIRFW